MRNFICGMAILCLLGCESPRQRVPATYEPREAAGGVWVFEFVANDQQLRGNDLSLFIECLKRFTDEHPNLHVVRIEPISTRFTAQRSDGTKSLENVVSLIVCTAPNDKK